MCGYGEGGARACVRWAGGLSRMWSHYYHPYTPDIPVPSGVDQALASDHNLNPKPEPSIRLHKLSCRPLVHCVCVYAYIFACKYTYVSSRIYYACHVPGLGKFLVSGINAHSAILDVLPHLRARNSMSGSICWRKLCCAFSL